MEEVVEDAFAVVGGEGEEFLAFVGGVGEVVDEAVEAEAFEGDVGGGFGDAEFMCDGGDGVGVDFVCEEEDGKEFGVAEVVGAHESVGVEQQAQRGEIIEFVFHW